ncbi:MAG: hypothetical protein ACPHGY_04645 [Rhodospirillaceae bacterium]
MNFNQKYLKATKAFDAKAYVEAIQVYLDLLQTDKDRILALTLEHDSARLIHNEMAIQFALQKVLIQRIRSAENIIINLEPFTRKHPLAISYGPLASESLENWKDGSTVFDRNKTIVHDRYTVINDQYLNGRENLEVIPGDVYAALWVVTDILDLEAQLPESQSGYVNLGCGCGLFDGAYLGNRGRTVSATLIDIDTNFQRSIDEQTKVHNLTQTAFSTEWAGYETPPSLVVSIRSCSYLYDVVTYDTLFRSLKPESQVFLDVAHKNVAKTTAYFESLGAHAKRHPRINEDVQFIEFRF